MARKRTVKPKPPGEKIGKTITKAVDQGHFGILKLYSAFFDCDEADLNRNDKCKNYEKCLTHAALSHWETFTCLLCDGTFDVTQVPGYRSRPDISRMELLRILVSEEDDEICDTIE